MPARVPNSSFAKTNPPEKPSRVAPPLGEQDAQAIQKLFKKLSDVSTTLNSASDALGRVINSWDAVLKELNLGLEVWVDTTSSGDSGDLWWDRGIGYARVQDKWGLALREREGNYPLDVCKEEVWAFNQAPRRLRIEGASRLVELLDKLHGQAEATADKLLGEAELLSDMVNAIKIAAEKGAEW